MNRLLTVVEVVSQASLEIGITLRPITTIIDTLDQDIAQMTALLSLVADDVLQDEPYKTQLNTDWCAGADNVVKAYPTADTDRVMFDGRLAINGLKFRFLKAKGLEYGEEERDFTIRMNKLAADANGRVLDLNDDSDGGRVV